jgi:hypothetical protein
MAWAAIGLITLGIAHTERVVGRYIGVEEQAIAHGIIVGEVKNALGLSAPQMPEEHAADGFENDDAARADAARADSSAAIREFGCGLETVPSGARAETRASRIRPRARRSRSSSRTSGKRAAARFVRTSRSAATSGKKKPLLLEER